MPKGARTARGSGANPGATGSGALAGPDLPNVLENLGKLGPKTVPEEPPGPNKHTDRVAWNKHVEHELSQKYDSFSYSTKPLEEQPTIMRTEGDLIRLALDDLVYGTLEADWAAMDVLRKEELVRFACPKMTIGHLAGDGEYNFVRMCSDAAPDFVKAALYWKSLLRTFYIVNTLLGILYAYHDRPAPPIHLPKATLLLRTEERKQDRRAFFSEFKKSGFNLEPHGKDELAITLYACYTCGLKTKDHLSATAQGRTGSFGFWGQERFDPSLLTPTPEADDSFIGCPTTVEGFRRPPALWRQIRSLSHNDSLLQDYHVGLIFYETSGGTLSLRIFDPPGAQMVFLVARRRGMASGSPPAVHMMFTIVKHQWQHVTGNPDITLEQIRSQFEMEYRVTMTGMGVEGVRALARLYRPCGRSWRRSRVSYENCFPATCPSVKFWPILEVWLSGGDDFLVRGCIVTSPNLLGLVFTDSLQPLFEIFRSGAVRAQPCVVGARNHLGILFGIRWAELRGCGLLWGRCRAVGCCGVGCAQKSSESDSCRVTRLWAAVGSGVLTIAQNPIPFHFHQSTFLPTFVLISKGLDPILSVISSPAITVST
ncbi:hypothetical protein C8J57DRAFT_1246108 [Mycena rebaudengoi]|nr:hypothetical protein C8J57DRAFT_1246108 [Mycena rebaudengoi]